MKKVLKLLLLLFVFSLIIQGFFVFFGKGYERTYTRKEKKKSHVIYEKYRSKTSIEPASYTLLIDQNFSFKVFDSLNKDSEIIKEIHSFKDEQYECVYPVFKNKKIKKDVLCKGSYYVYYQNIVGKDKKLDAFVENLPAYNQNDFIDSKVDTIKEPFLTVYKNNIQAGHYTVVQNYRGIYNIKQSKEKPINTLSYYNSDVYEPKIAALASKYFITASYNRSYDFNEIYIIDVTNNSKKELTTKSISLDSFIQGNIDHSVYLLDKSNRVQYKIDSKKKVVTETGRGNTIPFYENGEWIQKDMNEVHKDKSFSNKLEYQNKEYDSIYKSTDGLYYLTKKRNGKIEVSRVNPSYPNQIVFLFKTNELKNISFGKGFIYFSEEGYLKYYSDQTGLRTLGYQSEMNFNNDLKTFTYIK
ncbi:MAG: hypothetical protein PHN72_04030 [Bacilli bacterium]|nr:hypothetical protein [Bacilli bacterium]